MRFLKKIGGFAGIFIIKLYQWFLAPFFPPSCRFTPTCSQYGIEAMKRYGLIKGAWLTLKRISRCHPGGGSGYDPLL